jgi:Tfp pilus assembly protein PilN
MRPVNLIPPEQRRGDRAPMRTGPLSYVVVAVLGVALVGVTLLVLANNQVADRESEKASLQSQVSQAEAEAERLASFAEFASLQEAREETVSSLARSRFDWERVLRELALVIPSDVWLTGLTATATPDVTLSASTSGGSSTAGMATNVEGPSLQIQGCAAGHEAVARFIAALQDIGGVTRVSVLKSDRPELGGGGADAGAATSGDGCSSRDFVSTFEAVAAFDAVEVAAATPEIAPEPTPAPETAATAAQTADQAQVADAGQQLQQQESSAADKTQKGRNAADTFIPGTGTGP